MALQLLPWRCMPPAERPSARYRQARYVLPLWQVDAQTRLQSAAPAIVWADKPTRSGKFTACEARLSVLNSCPERYPDYLNGSDWRRG